MKIKKYKNGYLTFFAYPFETETYKDMQENAELANIFCEKLNTKFNANITFSLQVVNKNFTTQVLFSILFDYKKVKELEKFAELNDTITDFVLSTKKLLISYFSKSELKNIKDKNFDFNDTNFIVFQSLSADNGESFILQFTDL